MGFLDKVFNGAIDAVTGPGEFVVDLVGAARTAVTGDFGGAAEQVINSAQEDLLTQTIGGLFGPEGIGGAVIGALPEEVRAPARTVIDPVLGAWDWTIQEVVDRPLGTIFTVVNATHQTGIQSLFDAQTYAKAWNINDKRTFGQSFAANLFFIDPFDEDEYNSIQDDPIFNLISGTADFVQEFIDPVTIVGGTALKAARGAAVFGKATRPTRGALIGAPRDITRVYGGGTGLRPVRFKTSDQLSKRTEIIQSHTSQRAQAFVESKDFKRLDASMAKYATAAERAEAFRQETGRAGLNMTNEAVELLANAQTFEARKVTMRALAGDMTVMQEVSDLASELLDITKGDDWNSIVRDLMDPKTANSQATNQFVELSEKVDWAVMHQFRDALFGSQQFNVEFINGRYYTNEAKYLTGLATEDDALLRAALESIIATSDDVNLGLNAGQVRQLPFGNRLSGLLRQHQDVLDQNLTDEVVLSEFYNPHTVGGSRGGFFGKATRVISERTPQTHIFFDDPSAVDQFERVLTQANRVVVNDETLLAADQAAKLVSSFRRMSLQGEKELMRQLYVNTVEQLNTRLDGLLDAADLGVDVDPFRRTLSDEYGEASRRWQEEASRAVGVTDQAGQVTTTRKLPDGRIIVVNHRISPSQVQNSAVQPRYDVVQRHIELTQARQSVGPRRVAVKVGDVSRGVVGRGRHVLEKPQQAWRSGMLLTPKWPMRVGLDEQLRAAAVLGGITSLGNLITRFPDLRRAFALHKLDGIDEATDIDAITRILKEKVGEDVGDEGIETLYDLYKAAGEDGLDEAVKQLTREKVLNARQLKKRQSNARRLGRNAALKGIAFGALMGNPIAGAGYGFVAAMSKRRNINRALERKAALNYAGRLRHEAQQLLKDAVGPEEAAEARRMLDDATHIQKLIDSEDAAVAGKATEAKNTFDAAEELMQKAGVGGLSIGGLSFRNAFGDDPRFQEQIRASVSASRSQSAVYSGALRDAERQLRQFQNVDFKAWDSVVFDKDGNAINVVHLDSEWSNMMNLYTSAGYGQEFYDIVWRSGDLNERIEALAQLLEKDRTLFNNLVSASYKDLAEGELRAIAKNIVEEYENVLPSDYFGKLRESARSGERPKWQTVVKELNDMEGWGDDFALHHKIMWMRENGYPGFGKAVAPEPISHQGASRTVWGEKVAVWAEDLFKMFGTLPTDELARNPFFSTRYERELRRRVALITDPDGNVRLSQKQIDQLEKQARDSALTEVREVMYDLAENTRISELVGNSMPFFNAWQEVLGRWGGFALENPTFVGNMARLYRKEWDAQALGISEVTIENDDGTEGPTYLMFRPFGPAYDSDGNETTIFDAMSPTMRNLLIPKMLQDQDATVRFSKEGLNTITSAPLPGFGPLITVPVREAILEKPGLEETFGFMFPFGHPEGGFFERAVKGNLPTWAKSLDDYFRDSQTTERLVQRFFQDIVTQRAEAGDPIDWADDLELNAAIELANDRAKQFSMFRIAAGLFSPTSTTLLSPYEPLVQEARRLQREHGTLEGNSMFLELYGEDFFALTARMTQLNDGVAASIESEELYMKHQDLVQAHPDIGAWVTASLGSSDEKFVFSQAVYRRQMNMALAPGSDETRRSRKTPLESMLDTQAELGWREYTDLADYKRSKQEEAVAAGLSGSLNATHMRPLKLYVNQEIDALRKKYPAWAEQFDDFGSSTARMKDVVDGFVAGLQDEQLLQRPSTRHVIEYFDLRMYVQTRLQERKAEGGSDNIGNKSNEDLLLYWEQAKAELSLIPEFSAIYDRYFERDSLDRKTFVDDDAFEGLF